MSGRQELRSKRVYLDVCALCRPFDDQRQVRIRLETDAVELILAHVRQGRMELIASAAHDIEIRAISDLEERSHLTLLMQQLGRRPEFDLSLSRRRAERLVEQGLGVADAAHLSFAEQAQADFVTVDDQLVKKCGRIQHTVWCGTPPAYCEKESLK